jgi:PEP-CTERM motif
MKKIILTTSAMVGLAYGAFAQGSLGDTQGTFLNDGVTTGLSEANPANATTYYSGNISLEVFVASTANVTAGQVAAINALDGTASGGALALSALITDGFALESDPGTATAPLPAGGITFAVSGGDFTAADLNQINLLQAATGTTEYIALYAVAVGGAFNGDSGVLAFSQNVGGNPYSIPAGLASNITTDPTGKNLDLTSVPEPGTMALAGLGSLSLFLLRRKK